MKAPGQTHVPPRKIQIDFCDFWPGFSKTNNFFYQTLQRQFEVELADQPDILIYADPGSHAHRLQRGLKVYFGIESHLPDWRECDYAMTCHYLEDPRHLRLPFYALSGDTRQFDKSAEDPEALLAAKTRFCGFVVSNAGNRAAQKRVQFFQALSARKHVDSAGRTLNNMGGPLAGGWAGKLAFLKTCKFNIAFENKSLPGYTTEKIVQAMRARCIPIYWGSPRIHEEFNPRSFLNYFDFPSETALIERILELDRRDDLYLEMLRQPYLNENPPNETYQKERIWTFFDRILTEGPKRRARKVFSLGRWMWVKRNKPREP